MPLPWISAREAYGENNGWIYRWDVPHNIADLIELMGGKEAFRNNLETMYNTPLAKPNMYFMHNYRIIRVM